MRHFYAQGKTNGQKVQASQAVISSDFLRVSNDLIRFKYSWRSLAFSKMAQSGAKGMTESMDE